VAERWPELAKANGGGCNAILSRLPISEHGVLRLCRRPERRVAQLVRLSDGTRLVNLHASRKRAGAEEELARLLERVVPWAAGEPLILGGDLNLRAPEAPLTHLAGHNVDHIFAQRFVLSDEARLLDRTVLGAERFELSDHAALLLDVRPVERPLSQ
jgi:endonuclease/exonuclease/phosphatase family metal-dependent hydrolase